MIYFNFLNTEVCNIADDATFHGSDKDLSSLIKRLEHDSLLAINGLKIIT